MNNIWSSTKLSERRFFRIHYSGVRLQLKRNSSDIISVPWMEMYKTCPSITTVWTVHRILDICSKLDDERMRMSIKESGTVIAYVCTTGQANFVMLDSQWNVEWMFAIVREEKEERWTIRVALSFSVSFSSLSLSFCFYFSYTKNSRDKGRTCRISLPGLRNVLPLVYMRSLRSQDRPRWLE